MSRHFRALRRHASEALQILLHFGVLWCYWVASNCALSNPSLECFKITATACSSLARRQNRAGVGNVFAKCKNTHNLNLLEFGIPRTHLSLGISGVQGILLIPAPWLNNRNPCVILGFWNLHGELGKELWDARRPCSLLSCSTNTYR